MKLVVSNPEDGKTYQMELEETKAKTLYGKKIRDTVSGDGIGMAGYKLVITGGSDKQGFPMRFDVHGSARKRVLLGGGTGFHPAEKGERRRKSVRGNTLSEDIAQVNAKVLKKGKDGLDRIFGKAPKEEEPKKEEKAEPKKEEASKKEEPKKEEKAEPKKEEAKKEKAEAPKKEEKAPSEEKKK